MTGPEHWRIAENLTGVADGVMDYEHGVYSSMGTEERIKRRECFLLDAQVHATLALADAHLTGVLMHPDDRAEWDHATGRIEATR